MTGRRNSSRRIEPGLEPAEEDVMLAQALGLSLLALLGGAVLAYLL
jgi:hypothetical protein